MRGDQRTEEEFLALLQAIADEQWAISAAQSTLLQRQGQLAETANKLRPLARKILRHERARKRDGEVLSHPAALVG